MLGRTGHLFRRLGSTRTARTGQIRFIGCTNASLNPPATPAIRKAKTKWETSYSRLSTHEAEKRLGFHIDEVRAVRFKTMLAGGVDAKEQQRMNGIKDLVYARLIEYINIEGLPDANPDFKEANVNDLVLYTIGPIIDAVRKMGHNIRLRREKELVSVDGVTGGMEEFVVIDRIAVGEDKFVFVIEAKRTSVAQAMKQVLLSLKDSRDNNGWGTVYGFVTSGQQWKMLSYDGALFQSTREFIIAFDGMEEDKEAWIKECSVIVDCMVFALKNGGMVKNDVDGEER